MPTSASSYTHRIGRTARAGRAGIALSFVIPKEFYGKHRPTTIKSSEKDEKVLAKVTRQQEKLNRKLEPYNFNKSQMEAFRYRMNDGMSPQFLPWCMCLTCRSTACRHQGGHPGGKDERTEAGAAEERDVEAVSYYIIFG